VQILSAIWGILSIIGLLFAFIPLLGWLNWFNIPFAVIGLFISIVALSKVEPDAKKTSPIIGIVGCSIGIVVGFIRLVIGGGII
jgi:hypothetical protein